MAHALDGSKKQANSLRHPIRGAQFVAILVVVLTMIGGALSAQPLAAADQTSVNSWVTSADQSQLLAPQNPIELSNSTVDGNSAITLDPAQQYQTMDGFGASLTDSSAYVISQMSASQRSALMTKLFDVNNGAGLSYLRQPMGSSDFALSNYTYDDMPPGQTDPTLTNFSIAHDNAYILPLLRQALAINPSLKVMASPWSPPAWMRTGDSLIGSMGGTLDPQYYDAYAQYFVKFIQAYAAAGVPVDAVTVQNEPEFSPGDYPGMTLSANDEATFITHLGPALRAAGLATKIVAFDHNWSMSSYAKDVLANPAAAQYIDGTAFHCYSGDPTAQSDVRSADPSKNIYQTECSGGDWSPNFGDNLNWDIGHLGIGATRNWSKTVTLWNLALDPHAGPTNKGCTNCRGVVTVDPTTGAATYNVDYYALASFSKVVQPGAVRIGSSDIGAIGIQNVAFRNPDGSYGLVALNWGHSTQTVSVNADGKSFTTPIAAGSVTSFRWLSQPATTAGTSTTTSTTAPATTTTTVPVATSTTFPPSESPIADLPTPTLGSLSRARWTASASTTPSNPCCAVDVASHAIDGQLGTRWTTGVGQSQGQWFGVDLGQAQTFNNVTMDAGPSTGDEPNSYQVLVSNDEKQWNAVAAGAGTTQLTSITFANQHARYIRIEQTGSTGSWWSIAEFNVALVAPVTPSTTLSTAGWTASASSTPSDPCCTVDVASHAIDSRSDTRWTTGTAQTPGQWYQVDMGTSEQFSRVLLDAGSSTGDQPRQYDVYVSNDGSSWGQAVAHGNGTTSLTDITFPSQTARYIRITQDGSSGSWWSIAELRILR